MIGENYVRMVGFLDKPNFTTTPKGTPKLTGKIAMPVSTTDRTTGQPTEYMKYFKFTAWGDVGTDLSNIPEGTPIKIEGEYYERSYEGNCKACASPEKKYWTEINVKGFEVVSE